MSVKIGSNTQSLAAQRRLGSASSSLSSVYEKLSSGQRINKASDDAAGLAIASDLNSKARVYTQAIRNGNDGLSALAIADSAVSGLTDIVVRIRELSEQSANGSYSNTQRNALDTEAQALKKEYFRIAQSTEFNGVKLFDGTLGDGVRLQLGYGVEGSINASVGGAIGTGEFKARSTVATGLGPYSVTLGDLNGDGVLDIITADRSSNTASIMLGNGDGSFKARSTVATGSWPRSVTLGDLNGDGVLDIITADNGSSTASIMLGKTQSGVAPILEFSLKTKTDSLQAMGMLDNNLTNLAKQRGVIGSFQSRVQVALNNLTSSKENFKAAESRIKDADIAMESANLTRIQIVQQAGAAVLAQANQAPALALTLLR